MLVCLRRIFQKTVASYSRCYNTHGYQPPGKSATTEKEILRGLIVAGKKGSKPQHQGKITKNDNPKG